MTNAQMMQGDQYRIPIAVKNEDGTFLTQQEVEDVEVTVGQIRKRLSRGEIEFDQAESVFYVYVAQKETFSMRGNTPVQVRILFPGGDVVGVRLGKINFAQSASKAVLR